MLSLGMVLGVVWLHFVADFLLQSHQMATNKSKSLYWLTVHILVYMLPFLLLGWQYALLNGVLHWATDYWSSKVTSMLWKKNEVHWFFVVIGLDQAIHLTCLITTLPLGKFI